MSMKEWAEISQKVRGMGDIPDGLAVEKLKTANQ